MLVVSGKWQWKAVQTCFRGVRRAWEKSMLLGFAVLKTVGVDVLVLVFDVVHGSVFL
jgi:hypothetical protein